MKTGDLLDLEKKLKNELQEDETVQKAIKAAQDEIELAQRWVSVVESFLGFILIIQWEWDAHRDGEDLWRLSQVWSDQT